MAMPMLVMAAAMIGLWTVRPAHATVEHHMRLPEPACMPDSDRPFVFFHQRKTGGTSLRDEIFGSAKTYNLTAAIPCLTVQCHIMPERDWNHQVLAGHFTWGYVFSAMPHHLRKKPEISCLTVFREPMERLRSNFHYVSWVYGFSLLFDWNELTPKQMQAWMSETYNGQIAVNEPVRIFSGLGSDQLISSLYKYPVLEEQVIALTRQNLQSCVVLMQEDFSKPITSKILDYWFPWLNHTMVVLNANPHKPERVVFNEEQEALIRKVNAAEFALYNTAKEIYRRQLEFLKTAKPGVCGGTLKAAKSPAATHAAAPARGL